jgi:hypothetical protein
VEWIAQPDAHDVVGEMRVHGFCQTRVGLSNSPAILSSVITGHGAKTAKALGLAIPQPLITTADEVIE